MAREIIFTENAPKAVGPYVQAVRSNGMVYVSGQLGIDTAAGGLADGVEAQAHCSMKNLGAILRQAGTDYTPKSRQRHPAKYPDLPEAFRAVARTVLLPALP